MSESGEEDDRQLEDTIEELRTLAKAASDFKERKYFYDLVLKALALKQKQREPKGKGKGFDLK